MGRDDDAELLRLAGRDPEAFGRFYDRHADDVLRFFARRTGEPQVAADLTAETFAQAFAARRRFRRTGAPAAAWLYAIARHQLAHWVRRQEVERRGRSRLGVERLVLDDESLERIEQLADAADLRRELEGALHRLPEGVESAVRLRIADELPFAEVARRLGITEVAARLRVARGLDRLADLMERT